MCIFATMKRKIYVASSWRNEYYPEVVQRLREAERQFHSDIEAMEACDVCVLVLPCGRSAHTNLRITF